MARIEAICSYNANPLTLVGRDLLAYHYLMAGISGTGRGEITALTARGRRLLTVQDVSRALKIDSPHAAKRLARWERAGWLRRARRNLYIPVPIDAENPATWSEDALYLADAVWAPCYFTGWTTANHWGLTEQVFRTTVVKTTGRVRRTRERILDHDYLLSHVPEKHIHWGMSVEWREDRRVNLADPARTVIDILDDPRLSGGIRNVADVLAAYIDEHDPRCLLEYGDRLGNATVFKRLGYLMSALELGPADVIDECRQRLASGISLLDPTATPQGDRQSEWGLRVNVRLDHVGAS
ncbi:MAG: type IV toxin-antitoxin system AbiEi family antitoxin domain-containing protein [Actinomycetota bacterium]